MVDRTVKPATSVSDVCYCCFLLLCAPDAPLGESELDAPSAADPRGVGRSPQHFVLTAGKGPELSSSSGHSFGVWTSTAQALFLPLASVCLGSGAWEIDKMKALQMDLIFLHRSVYHFPAVCVFGTN